MPEGFHQQVPVKVWVEVDEDIAGLVLYLNTIPGIRTHASCQGTLGEGGEHPYRPQVLVSWDTPGARAMIEAEFDLTEIGPAHCYVHPREELRP